MVHASTGSNVRINWITIWAAIVAGIIKLRWAMTKWLEIWFGGDYAKIRDFIEKVFRFWRLQSKDQQPGIPFRNSAREREWRLKQTKPALELMIPWLRQIKFVLWQCVLTINNTTIYGMDDRYRGIKNERMIVFMVTEDMKNLNLTEMTAYAWLSPEDERFAK